MSAAKWAIGPELPFITTSRCCDAARRSGHSCIAQHFGRLKRRCADETDLGFWTSPTQNPLAKQTF